MAVSLLALFLTLGSGSAQEREYEKNIATRHEAIRYWKDSANDPVSRLIRRVEDRSVELHYADDGTGYLSSLLQALDIDASSQVLVFSKTSLQRSRISPESPRAIYFGTDVAVGYVPGGDALELASLDPRQGSLFYTLAAEKSASPQFDRPPICLSCHHDVATLGVPGMYVGSVRTSETGRPSYRGSIVSDHRTPFEDRWGGWFVDGSLGTPHRGNAAASGPQSLGLASLLRRYDPSAYLEPTSDVVALMVLEHQTQMANYFTRLSWEHRTGDGPTDERLREVARYMVFADEAPFDGPVEGASAFQDRFPREGPRDAEGRSLRELDLKTRLFRYPLSYMIQSDVFQALPPVVRERLLRSVLDALASHPDQPAAKAALAIAAATVPGLSDGAPRERDHY